MVECSCDCSSSSSYPQIGPGQSKCASSRFLAIIPIEIETPLVEPSSCAIESLAREGNVAMTDDSAKVDATNEGKDALGPEINTTPKYDIELNPDIVSGKSNFPNNFYLTEHNFLESVPKMNDATRHRGVWYNGWKIIEELGGEEVICDHTKDGKVVWKIIE